MIRIDKHCNEMKENVKTDINHQFSRICRGCLATERRMMKATSYEDMFQDLTGIIISSTDGLPQWLCYECSALLHKCCKFRNKIMKSHYKLCQYVLESLPLEKLDNDVNKCESDVPASIIETESVQVKDESMSSDREDNIAEEECSVNHDGFFLDALSKLPIDDEIEQEEQEDQTSKVVDDTDAPVLTKHESVEVVEEPLYRGYKRDNAPERYREDTRQFQLASLLSTNDLLDINSAVTLKYEERAEEGEASCQEPHVGTEAAQQQLHKHVGSFRTSGFDKETQHPADTRHSDDAEEEVKQNIYRDDSVNNSSRSNVQSYICDACNNCFSDKTLLLIHIPKHSAEKSFKCDVCCKGLLDINIIQDLGKHSNEKLYSGDVSDKRSKLETSFTAMHTRNKPYKCDVCKKCFGSKCDLNRHMRLHTGDKAYKCDVCMKCFTQKTSLITHFRIHTGDKPYKCEICMKCFVQKHHLNTHMRVHTGERPYKCDVCLKCFDRKDNLNRHMRLHTGDKPYKCDICMRRFSIKSNLNQHNIRVHIGDKPYKCDVCMKCFAKKYELNMHMRLHTGDKPYKCDICMTRFTIKSNLNQHIRVHTGDKPYKCEICMKCFVKKHHLNTHMRVHTGERPYKCDVCMKCFCQIGNLNAHMRVHTGDKPYKCDVCLKCFGKKYHLNMHMHVHTGAKPYKCDVCMKCFNRKSNLNLHMRLHTRSKPYKCDVCMKCFGKKKYFKAHMLIHTGDKTSPSS